MKDIEKEEIEKKRDFKKKVPIANKLRSIIDRKEKSSARKKKIRIKRRTSRTN
jgi:hypothetical protein